MRLAVRGATHAHSTGEKPCKSCPLGASYDGAGTSFSILSEEAEKVGVCILDNEGEQTRVDLLEVTGFCWHGCLPALVPGQRYGFRVHGPWPCS